MDFTCKASLFALVLCVLSLHSTLASDVYTWNVTDKSNNTCILAQTSIGFHVLYTKVNESKPLPKYLGFTNKTAAVPNSADCSKDSSITVTIRELVAKTKQTLSLTFKKTGEIYALTHVNLVFVVDNGTFVNATNLNATVTASATNLNLLETPLYKAYTCKLDSQIELQPTKPANMPLLYLDIDQVAMLEAFPKTADFDSVSKCFHDQKPTPPSEGNWVIKDAKDATCARVKSTLTLNMQYKDISNKVNNVMVPVTSGAKIVNSSCSDNTTSMTLDVEGMNLTMTFLKVKQRDQYFMADEFDYVLDGFTLDYAGNNAYLQNHKGYAAKHKASKSGLMLHSVPVGNSYQCDVTEPTKISDVAETTDGLVITLDGTKWEAFGMKSDNFSNAHFCPEEPTTTPAIPTAEPNPIVTDRYTWKAVDSKNNTCLLISAGLQLRASYLQNGTQTPVHFDFTNMSMISTSDCDAKHDSFNFTLWDRMRDQNLTMTYNKTSTDYSLTAVYIQFNMSDKYFPNNTNTNKIVAAKATNLKLMQTSIKNSYTCSMETQVELSAKEMPELYIKITEINYIQAFLGNETNVTKGEECFPDQKPVDSTVGDWNITKDNKTCLRVNSKFTLHVAYYDISDKVNNVMVPVTSGAKIVNSACSDNTTSMTLDVEGMNLTMTFLKVKQTAQYFMADEFDYVLDGFKLDYTADNKYLQNHRGYGGKFSVAKSNMALHSTRVGKSYRCDYGETQPVARLNETAPGDDGLDIELEKSQWQAFGFVNTSDAFGDAKFCPEEVSSTAVMTTAGTPQPTPPLPADPPVGRWLAQTSDNKTCFLANMGVQLRIWYNATGNTRDKMAFNFDRNSTAVTCVRASDDETALTLNHTRHNMTLTLTFSRDKKGQSYVSGAQVRYNVTARDFPDVDMNKEKPLNPHNYVTSGLSSMTTPANMSFSCQGNETDLLISPPHVHTSVVLRLTGLQWQAFGVSKQQFSAAHKCFSDVRPTKAYDGEWKVNTTDGKTVCARYKFKAAAWISYITMLGEVETVLVPLDNATTRYDGVCGNETSTLWVSMDDDKIRFTFFFNESQSSSPRAYEMNLVQIDYSGTSKYFPNHLHFRDSDDEWSLYNSAPDLFHSDGGHSYKCDALTSLPLTWAHNRSHHHTGHNPHHIPWSRIDFSDVQVQPFGITTAANGTFSAVDDCAADDDLSPIIPIIVGAILAGLIVLVLIAYFIGRSRAAKNNEYSTI